MSGRAKFGRTKRRRLKNRRPKYIFNRSVELCSSDKSVIELRQWMKRFGRSSSSLVPALFPDTGRGLCTKRAIQPEEVIVSLPRSLLITTKNVLDSEIGIYIKRWIPKLSPQQCLSVFLVWEQRKQTLSSWYPYIKLLPASFKTPAYFTSSEFTFLPKSVRVKGRNVITQLGASFDEVKQFSMKNWSEFANILSYEKFRWAWYVINTRSVFLRTEPSEYLNKDADTIALAPFLDLLNHSPTANIKAGISSDGSSYEIVTYNKYKAYDQVFISYGCHSNQTLFVEYGFCVPDNPNDEMEVFYDDVIKVCDNFNVEHQAKKLVILQEHNLLKSLTCTKEGLSWKLLTVLKTLAMDWNQLQHWSNVFTDELSFPDLVPQVNTFTRYILQRYLDENKQLEKHIEQTVCEDDDQEHVDIARYLQKLERDIILASLPL